VNVNESTKTIGNRYWVGNFAWFLTWYWNRAKFWYQYITSEWYNMTFYAQLLWTHQLLTKKKIVTLSILLEIHTFYVCPSTIETSFNLDYKPEEITERLLKGN